MLYYRVKPEADNKYKNLKIHNGDIYIANELYTLREVEVQRLNLKYLDPVEISKKNVYFSFGARFAMDGRTA